MNYTPVVITNAGFACKTVELNTAASLNMAQFLSLIFQRQKKGTRTKEIVGLITGYWGYQFNQSLSKENEK